MKDIFSQFNIGQKNGEIDANGICMASVQGLHKLVQKHQLQLTAQQAQLEQHAAQLVALEGQVKMLDGDPT